MGLFSKWFLLFSYYAFRLHSMTNENIFLPLNYMWELKLLNVIYFAWLYVLYILFGSIQFIYFLILVPLYTAWLILKHLYLLYFHRYSVSQNTVNFQIHIIFVFKKNSKSSPDLNRMGLLTKRKKVKIIFKYEYYSCQLFEILCNFVLLLIYSFFKRNENLSMQYFALLYFCCKRSAISIIIFILMTFFFIFEYIHYQYLN